MASSATGSSVHGLRDLRDLLLRDPVLLLRASYLAASLLVLPLCASACH